MRMMPQYVRNHHWPKYKDMEEEHVHAAVLFATSMISQVEGYLKLKRQGWPKQLREEEGLLIMRDKILQVCGDVKLEDFLWKDI
jgi:hypothetical protein